jgi:hypothetical protein
VNTTRPTVAFATVAIKTGPPAASRPGWTGSRRGQHFTGRGRGVFTPTKDGAAKSLHAPSGTTTFAGLGPPSPPRPAPHDGHHAGRSVGPGAAAVSGLAPPVAVAGSGQT